MIKKLMVFSSLIACSLVAGQVSAKPMICPFTDYFTIDAPYDDIVRDLSADGNINVSLSSDTAFTTSCKSIWSTGSGNAYLVVGSSAHVCHLTILDGPYENNPTVTNVTCTDGLQYAGMDHSKGSYNYTLKFN